MPNDKKFTNWKRQELINYISHLENDFRKENNEFLNKHKWAGNLGQWLWNYEKDIVVFNEKKVLNIGYDVKEIGTVGFKFFTDKIHPEDYLRVMKNMSDHLRGQSAAYEVEYRIKHHNGHYIWYYDRGVVTKRDKNGKALFVEGIVFDITESKHVEDQLKALSERDALTNLYNRRMLYKFINSAISSQQEQNIPFSLIMFDIDNFKQINDNFGHLVGDKVLRNLSSLIQTIKRPNDEVFRFGGEEFIILLNNTAQTDAITLGKTVHKKISEFEDNEIGKITVSMGIVEYKCNETVDKLLNRVDKLMYSVKKYGKNDLNY